MLWQTLQIPSLGDTIFEAVKHNLPFEWTKKRLYDALEVALNIISCSHAQGLVFLDGLDEADTDGQGLIAFVRDISENFPKVKLCVSSRPEPIYQNSLSNRPQLKMQDLNRPDVLTIVNQGLIEAPEFESFTDSRYKLDRSKDHIVHEAQGVLLWVRIVVRDLLVHAANGDALVELRAQLERLPAELKGESGLFTFMLKRNATYSKKYLTEAALYLQIACQEQVSTLRYALATDGSLGHKYFQFSPCWENLHI